MVNTILSVFPAPVEIDPDDTRNRLNRVNHLFPRPPCANHSENEQCLRFTADEPIEELRRTINKFGRFDRLFYLKGSIMRKNRLVSLRPIQSFNRGGKSSFFDEIRYAFSFF